MVHVGDLVLWQHERDILVPVVLIEEPRLRCAVVQHCQPSQAATLSRRWTLAAKLGNERFPKCEAGLGSRILTELAGKSAPSQDFRRQERSAVRYGLPREGRFKPGEASKRQMI